MHDGYKYLWRVTAKGTLGPLLQVTGWVSGLGINTISGLGINTIQSFVYISNLVVPYKPVRALRSSDKHLLTVPRTSSTLGYRAFSVAAPILFGIHYLLISDVVTLFNHLRLCWRLTYIIRCITDNVQLCIFNCVMFYVCTLLFAPRNRIF